MKDKEATLYGPLLHLLPDREIFRGIEWNT